MGSLWLIRVPCWGLKPFRVKAPTVIANASISYESAVDDKQSGRGTLELGVYDGEEPGPSGPIATFSKGTTDQVALAIPVNPGTKYFFLSRGPYTIDVFGNIDLDSDLESDGDAERAAQESPTAEQAIEQPNGKRKAQDTSGQPSKKPVTNKKPNTKPATREIVEHDEDEDSITANRLPGKKLTSKPSDRGIVKYDEDDGSPTMKNPGTKKSTSKPGSREIAEHAENDGSTAKKAAEKKSALKVSKIPTPHNPQGSVRRSSRNQGDTSSVASTEKPAPRETKARARGGRITHYDEEP